MVRVLNPQRLTHTQILAIFGCFYFLLSFSVVLTEVLVSRGIVMSMRRQVLSFLLFSRVSGLLAAMVLSVWDGHVPQNSDALLLGDSLGFMLIPSLLHLNTKLFADLPVHVRRCLIVEVYVFSFSQFRAARDQMVNGLSETATQSSFWVHVRLLEDVVVVPACWEALILGSDDKSLSFSLEARCF